MSETTFFPIPSGHLGGIIAVNVVAALANLALIPVGIRVAWLVVRRIWSNSPFGPLDYVFFHTQLGLYVICFIAAMLFNTISGILGFPWLFMKGIRDGQLCRAQAVFMAIGTFSGGFFTIAIAVHTFGALVLQKRQSIVICRSTICAGWGLSFLTAAIPFVIHPSEGSVYGPDDFVCGIRSIFPKLQFFFHLLPILLSSLFGIVLYSLIFFALRGTVKVRQGIKLTLNPTKRWAEREKTELYHRFVMELSRSMLWYPVAYIVFLVPYSMLRLFAISGFAVPFEAMAFAFVCWYILNVVEVPLLYNTFRLLGRAFDGVSVRNSQRESDTISNGELQRKYADLADRRLVGSIPPTPTTFTSPDIAFDKILSANHPSYAVTHQTFMEADPATKTNPTTFSGLGYFDDISIYSSFSPDRTSRAAVVAPLVPIRPPRTLTALSIPHPTLMRQTSSSAQDNRSASPLTTTEPTYRGPFKFY